MDYVLPIIVLVWGIYAIVDFVRKLSPRHNKR